MKRSIAFLAIALVFGLAACDSASGVFSDGPSASSGVIDNGGKSYRLVVPKSYPGNFVSSDNDQVCYDMIEQGLIDLYTGDLRGFKVDLPGVNNDAYVTTTLEDGGRSLKWNTQAGTTILAFIIKGGPNFNVYDYVKYPGVPPFQWNIAEEDSKLVSPLHSGPRRPALSHYNGCYVPPQNGDFEGCTPGYWRNHADRWLGADPEDDFDATFSNDKAIVDFFSPDITLGMAISNPQTYGTFAFHAVAALLNSYGGVANTSDGETVDYEYTTEEVIAMVQAAFASGDLETTKDLFAAANEAGCPLSGTRAVKV